MELGLSPTCELFTRTMGAPHNEVVQLKSREWASAIVVGDFLLQKGERPLYNLLCPQDLEGRRISSFSSVVWKRVFSLKLSEHFAVVELVLDAVEEGHQGPHQHEESLVLVEARDLVLVALH